MHNSYQYLRWNVDVVTAIWNYILLERVSTSGNLFLINLEGYECAIYLSQYKKFAELTAKHLEQTRVQTCPHLNHIKENRKRL